MKELPSHGRLANCILHCIINAVRSEVLPGHLPAPFALSQGFGGDTVAAILAIYRIQILIDIPSGQPWDVQGWQAQYFVYIVTR